MSRPAASIATWRRSILVVQSLASDWRRFKSCVQAHKAKRPSFTDKKDLQVAYAPGGLPLDVSGECLLVGFGNGVSDNLSQRFDKEG